MLKKEHKTFEDNRGSYTPLSVEGGWEQVSVSCNDKKFTFRGMHYQTNPPQTKYVKVIKGKIIDYLYDLETKELKLYEITNQDAILVPNNYAHGFLTLEDDTIVAYMVKGEYNPKSEHSIVWNTIPELNDDIKKRIDLHPLTISEKDMIGK